MTSGQDQQLEIAMGRMLMVGVTATEARKTAHLHMDLRPSSVFPLILDATCPVLTITAEDLLQPEGRLDA
jgi:hypothetical protein